MRPLDPRLLRRARGVSGYVRASAALGVLAAAAIIVQAGALADIVTATFLHHAGLAGRGAPQHVQANGAYAEFRAAR